jgi:hypothetical protein
VLADLLERGTIRLEPGRTKNRDGRLVYLAPDLVARLRAQLERVDALQRQLQRVIVRIFVHPRGYLAGRPIKEFYRAWCPQMLFHAI